jgi:hypothetical protein
MNFIKLLTPLVFSSISLYAGQFQADQNTFALYHFNEGTGTTLYDSSGNGYNGTITGCTWVQGKFGTALSFNGTTSSVVVNQSMPIRNISFELWCKPNPSFLYTSWNSFPAAPFSGNQFSIFGTYGSYDAGICIDSAQDSIYFYSSSSAKPFGKIPIQNSWLYIAATIDSNDTLRLYINGQFISKSYDPETTRQFSRFYFGAMGYNSEMIGYFAGTIDESRISTIVRSPEEISAYWAANISNPGVLNATIYNGSTDATISGATVQMTSGGNQSQATNSTGSAIFANLGAGNYIFSATAQGFMPDTGIKVTIFASETTYVGWLLTPLPVPIAPKLLTPKNIAVNVSASPTIQWNAVAYAASYRLQASLSSKFTNELFDQSGINDTQISIASLPYSSVIYWHANAANFSGTSIWSPAWSFTTVPSIPAIPVLVSPSNSASNASLAPTLNWNVSSGAASYRLQISSTSDFSGIIIDQSSLTATSLTISGLSYSSTYYWRGNATNAGGTSSWSSSWIFATISWPLPSTPTLVSPTITSAIKYS